MAKINIVKKPGLWLVKVTVDDPGCLFSIKPHISYDRIVKAQSEQAAVAAAATYCNNKMHEYPGVHFSYSADDVKCYLYPIQKEFVKED